MASRWWVVAGAGATTIASLICLWMVVANGYVRLFLDAAVAQVLCRSVPSFALETVAVV